MCWHHNVHIVCAQSFHPLPASPRMLCVYFLVVQLGLRHHFCYPCITLSFFIICRTTNRKLNLSDLYDLLMTNVEYMTIHNVHVPQLWTFFSYEYPLVPCCPDKRGFTGAAEQVWQTRQPPEQCFS